MTTLPCRRPGNAGLDPVSAGLRDGTDELGRRLRAVLAYLNQPSGGRVLSQPRGSHASGRAGNTPVPGPAATT